MEELAPHAERLRSSAPSSQSASTDSPRIHALLHDLATDQIARNEIDEVDRIDDRPIVPHHPSLPPQPDPAPQPLNVS